MRVFTMLNKRIVLSQIVGVLFVLFITSAAWGQQGSQAESVLSESETIKIIREIHQLEKNVLKEIHDLDTKMLKEIHDLDTGMLKEIHDLEVKMRDHVDKKISGSTTTIILILAGIGIPVILHFLKLTFPGIYFWQNKKKDVLEGITNTFIEPLADNNPINQTSPQGNL